MGLDCTAYQHAELLPDHPAGPCGQDEDDPWESCYNQNHVQTFCYPDFERSMAGLVIPAARFTLGKQEFSGGSWYQCSGQEEGAHNSYGGHSFFRRMLCETILKMPWDGYLAHKGDEADPFFEGEPPDTFLAAVDFGRLADSPFFELLYFADNEGTIGPLAAAKLYKDFVEHEEAFLASLVSGGHGDAMEKQYWGQWKRMCEVAADTGLIVLH